MWGCGCAPASIEVHAHAAATDLDVVVEMIKGRVLNLRVFDAEGNCTPHASVMAVVNVPLGEQSIMLTMGYSIDRASASKEHEEAGFLRLVGLPGSGVKLVVSTDAPGQVPVMVDVPPTILDLDLRLR